MPRLIQTQASSNVRARTHGIIRYMHNVYITQQKQINSVRKKVDTWRWGAEKVSRMSGEMEGWDGAMMSWGNGVR